MSNNNPSLDPANNGSLAGSVRFAFSKLLQDVNGMLPAQVIEYDRVNNRVSVQLLINLLTTDGTQVARPQISSMPVMIFGGGNFMISFPLKTGDLGWVLANDRDISLFLQSYAQSPPNTLRVKNFSDGVFIPDVMRGYTSNGGDTDNMVIQSTDGTSEISIGAASITIKHPTLIHLEAPSITIDLGNPLNIMAVNGSITATGTITP